MTTAPKNHLKFRHNNKNVTPKPVNTGFAKLPAHRNLAIKSIIACSEETFVNQLTALCSVLEDHTVALLRPALVP